MSKEQCQSCGESIGRAHSIRICNSNYSDILQWYKIFGNKVYVRKENSSVLLLIWNTYNQCLQVIVKLSDHNTF